MRTQSGTPAGTTNWFGSSRTPPPPASCFLHLHQQHTKIKTETMAKTIIRMKTYLAVMLANLLTYLQGCVIINYFSCCCFFFFLFSCFLSFSFSFLTLFTFPFFLVLFLFFVFLMSSFFFFFFCFFLLLYFQ